MKPAYEYNPGRDTSTHRFCDCGFCDDCQRWYTAGKALLEEMGIREPNHSQDELNDWQERQRTLENRAVKERCCIPMPALAIIEHNWQATKSYRMMRQRSKGMDGKHFIYSHGPRWTGKTIAACRILLEMAKESGLSGEYIGCVEYALSSDIDTIKRIERLTKSQGIILLDDVGAEKRNSERIAAALTYRYQHGLRTLITSNFAPDRLPSIYDNRIKRRIEECSTIVECREIVRGR